VHDKEKAGKQQAAAMNRSVTGDRNESLVHLNSALPLATRTFNTVYPRFLI
jgi:hypothetical protein